MGGRWDQYKTWKFVKFYREQTCLWDATSPMYKNRIARDYACQIIMRQMDEPELSPQLIRTKINNLRSTFCQELKKVKDSSNTYKPSILWFDEMNSFLGGAVKSRVPTVAPTFVLESTEPKSKKGKNIVFTTVKQACVEMVKKNVCEASLFDDESFRSILQLLPMTSKEKAKITAEYIQKYVDMTGDDEEAEMSVQDDANASDNDDDTTDRVINIKGEIEEESNCQCSARTADDSSKCHEIGCPAAAKQPYWNYFEVTTDEATCQICDLTLTWTNITKLKDHLLEKHPTAEFVDDGEEFTRGPASDVWSHEETEEIYLEDFDNDPLPTASTRKRKRTSDRLKGKDGTAQGGGGEEKETREGTRDLREETQRLSKAHRRIVEMAPERFKSLDVFGQYVAELMKLIPKEKCLKYQVQIVQRLLQEQAAAG